MNNQERLTKRDFLCKDSLWNIFQQISNDSNCTIDFLINEAMQTYVQERNYDLQPARIQQPSKFSRPPSLFAEMPYNQQPPAPQRIPQPIPQQLPQQAPFQQPPQPYQAPNYNPQPYLSSPNTRQLTLIYNNQRYPINKERFIIGRASQITDLAIRDSNISRKHCAVIQRNGAYYIKDLNSTNGIEYKNNRIDSKKIEEGDQFNVCEHVFEFTYH